MNFVVHDCVVIGYRGRLQVIKVHFVKVTAMLELLAEFLLTKN